MPIIFIISWESLYNSSGIIAQLEDSEDIGFDIEGKGMLQPHHV